MMKIPFFLFLLLCFFSACSLSSVSGNLEVETLINIKNDLYDPLGVLKNWDESSVDPCSWTMITCSTDSLVISLGASNQSLSGTLSGSIGNLTNLQQVILENNKISGKIPSELGTLPKLRLLDLSNNQLCGEIPRSVNQLTSLQYIDLSCNNLTGPVPKFHGRINVAGNPLICKNSPPEICSGLIIASPPSVSLPSSSGRKSNLFSVSLGITLGLLLV